MYSQVLHHSNGNAIVRSKYALYLTYIKIKRKLSVVNYHFSSMHSGQILADPQPQAGPTSALEIVAIELGELLENAKVILEGDSWHSNYFFVSQQVDNAL